MIDTALVEPGWLASRLEDRRLRVLDVTVQITPEFAVGSGRPDWEASHLPGSAFGDLLEGSPSLTPALARSIVHVEERRRYES